MLFALARLASLRAHSSAPAAKFAFDGVLPLQYMLKISEAYLREGGDPRNDYTVSPLYAPPDLLAQFPPVRVHVGAVDPLVDESIAFVRRLHGARARPRPCLVLRFLR